MDAASKHSPKHREKQVNTVRKRISRVRLSKRASAEEDSH